ncbi:hypothetical protein GDO78_023278 [Eleutherodactylus coqui]|uniref:Uncharacterized protein n=1 Tax=Eleutherodactylus coqui TaxID=57060 RepID=A0A8J6BHH1_ELECQ|nr:hypothetical protein GDO78_023278 [Eleutherodactylus coqui]
MERTVKLFTNFRKELDKAIPSLAAWLSFIRRSARRINSVVTLFYWSAQIYLFLKSILCCDFCTLIPPP